MDLFQIFGTLAIKGMDAFNSDIKSASATAEESSGEIGSAFEGMATKIGSALIKAGDNITNLGKKLAPVSALATTVITGAIKSASDYENAIAKTSTLVDTAVHPVSELSDMFIELSNNTGKSATELAEAGYQALSASVDYDHLGEFVATATNLAKVGFTDSATAVDVLTTAINAYGLDASDADKIANQLVNTQNLGKTTVDELASSMGRVIPTASSMNVSLENLTSAYVGLTRQGVSTRIATTNITAMLNELGDSGTDVAGILKERTGKSFQDLMSEGKSLGDVLQILNDHCTESNTNFNELWGSSQAGAGAVALVNAGADEFNKTMESMNSNMTVLSEGLEKLDTPSAKISRTFNRVKNSGIELGESFISALLPTIEKVCGMVEQATTWFNGLDDGTKTLIASVIGGIAVLSPVLIIGGKIISGIGNLITKLPVLIGTVTKLFSLLLANPIGLVVTAVVALVAGFIYLWNTSEDFRQFWIDLWNSIVELVTNVVTGISEFLIQAWTDITTGVQNAWNAISQFFSDIWNAISTTVTTILTGISNFLSTTWNAITTSVQNVWNGISNIISSILNSIRNTFSSIWNAISSLVSSIFNSIRNNISTNINSALSIVTSVLNNIRNAFSNILNSAFSVVSGVISRIKGLFNFSWSLPHLKLPHVSISGSFSLMPPSVPHFSLSWYKKAMDNPYMFTEPTMFSYDPSSNVGKVAGEAGDEMMYGKSNLMNDIGNVVSSQNLGVIEKLNVIISILNDYLPEIIDKAVKEVVLDSGVLVGELAPAMNTELGQISRRAGR